MADTPSFGNGGGALSLGARLDRIERGLDRILERLDAKADVSALDQLARRVQDLYEKGSLHGQQALTLAQGLDTRTNKLELLAARFTDADIQDAHNFRRLVESKFSALDALQGYKRWAFGLVASNGVAIGIAVLALIFK